MSLENILADLKEPECTELNSVPPKFHPDPVSMTWFGNRVFAEIIKFKCAHTGLDWVLHPI